MKLTNQQKRELKARAHHLKPVVIIGNQGLTDNVRLEVDEALDAHELIKIRINAQDKSERLAFAQTLCDKLDAGFIGLIGHIGTIYRKNLD